MRQPTIEPHKVTTPIQLLAVWFAALVLVVGLFLGLAAVIDTPVWLRPTLAIASVVFVPLFLVAAFVMQTVFRTHLQEDPYYAEWLKRKEQAFADFTPENLSPRNLLLAPLGVANEPPADFERRRIERYEQNRGLFLVHEWRPSTVKGQVADIVIWLHQHGEGPLSEGQVEKVQYQLGPKFFESPVDKCNARDSFKIEVSAYGPMLCLAKVFIKGELAPVELERYINFEDAP